MTDWSGAVMPEATVTLTNTATNVSQSATTSNVGYYIFPVVQVGNYSLKVQKSGFQTATSDLTLDVGQRGRLDVPLKPGGGNGNRNRAGRSGAASNAGRLSPEASSRTQSFVMCR